MKFNNLLLKQLPMFKKICFTLVFFLFHFLSQAQVKNISGVLKDTTSNSNLQFAVISLLNAADSTLVNFTRANAEGKYLLKNVLPGIYIIWVMHPAIADYVEEIEITNNTETLAPIALTAKSKLLEAVIVRSGGTIRIKGDTTIFNADSFKVEANANVEELLKKLPGLQVGKNGEIKAMGETVQKVLVDGEEFFGNDPGMAVKNLRADAVKEVQVFDKKSEQAEFTGIDDGKTQKTINLKLKEDKKTGYFGKIDVSGGLKKDIDDRYNNNLLYSNFKGKRKLSAFALNGNTGQDGLSWEDSRKLGGENDDITFMDDGGIMIYSSGGTNREAEPYVDTDNGYIKNINAGLQYNNKWNDKTKLNLSPKYNSQDYQNFGRVYSQTQLGGDSLLNDYSNTQTYVDRYNLKFNGIYEVKLDSFNTLKFTGDAGFYKSISSENYDARTLGATNNLKNSSQRFSNFKSQNEVFSGSLNYQHKFKKLRRTFSLRANFNNLNNEGSNTFNSVNKIYDPINPSEQILNQNIDNNKTTNSFGNRMVYTEPLSKKYSLELSHATTINTGKNLVNTYNFNPVTQQYDTIVDSLSNDFDQKIIENRPAAKISYSTKKIKFNIGSGFGFTNFSLNDVSYNKKYKRNYVNFFPEAFLLYTYKSNHSFRINYSGYNQQPGLNQLQPLRNSTNLFNQYIGNPDLKPSFTNSIGLWLYGYDLISGVYKQLSFNVRNTQNAIINKQIIDATTGKRINQPVNANGNYNLSLWSGFGKKLKKLNLDVDLGPSFSYGRNAVYLNNIFSYTKVLQLGSNLNIRRSVDKKYDFVVRYGFNYNKSKNSKEETGYHYSSNDLVIEGTLYHKKVWSLKSDYIFYSRQKTIAAGTGLNTQVWNAALQRTFKKNEFTLYFKVRDILNQNVDIQKNYYGKTYTETENERLKRYFLLGFKWDFINKTKTAK